MDARVFRKLRIFYIKHMTEFHGRHDSTERHFAYKKKKNKRKKKICPGKLFGSKFGESPKSLKIDLFQTNNVAACERIARYFIQTKENCQQKQNSHKKRKTKRKKKPFDELTKLFEKKRRCICSGSNKANKYRRREKKNLLKSTL